MAGPGGDYKFLKTIFMAGFGAFAAALVLQRRELNKYGYDLHLGGTDINNADLTACIAADGTSPVDPANPEHKKLSDRLKEFREEGMTHQVYLARAHRPEDIVPARVKEVPMLVRCDNGKTYAYINNNHGVVEIREILAARAGGDLYKDLHFPREYFSYLDPKSKRQRSHGAVHVIDNDAIVKDLETNEHHLHVSKSHAHKDSRMDNRFLILKNEYAGPPAVEGYYVYVQGNNGAYVLRKIDNPAMFLKEIDYEHGPFTKDKFTQISRNMTVIGRVLDSHANGRSIRGGQVDQEIKVADGQETFSPAELARHEAKQRQKLLLFSGALGATEVPSVFQQAKGSGSYYLMNKMSAGGGSIGKKVKEAIAPIRHKLHI
jgi:hypothetical protein